MQQSETICALATPPGIAGLAVIRISGKTAIETANAFFSGVDLDAANDHTIHYGWWTVGAEKVDAITATVFRAPRSYTGEDVVEIGCHGGPFVVRQVIDSLTASHARLAEPGEFTRRAFLNGKLNITQVEAVADLIHSQTTVGAKTAARQLAGGFTAQLNELRDNLITSSGLLEVELDFSEEGYEFVSREQFNEALKKGLALAERLIESASTAEILRSGFYCAVVGFPNAGKSALFNGLLGRSRAIVSHIPGTTRDYLEESLIVDGYTIHIYDTAGIRETTDTIEMQGIVLTETLLEQSDLILVVNDASVGFEHSDDLAEDIRGRFSDTPVVIMQNKMDLVDNMAISRNHDVFGSAIDNAGLGSLRSRLKAEVTKATNTHLDVLINARQRVLLESLHQSLTSASNALQIGAPADLIAIDIRTSVRILGEITGETWNPDILDNVFSQFCMGK